MLAPALDPEVVAPIQEVHEGAIDGVDAPEHQAGHDGQGDGVRGGGVVPGKAGERPAVDVPRFLSYAVADVQDAQAFEEVHSADLRFGSRVGHLDLSCFKFLARL